MLVIGISSCESSLKRSLAAASNPCDPSCDPPAWCGAATTSLYGGRGDPHPLWRSSLVEPGAKVTVIVFTEETWWPSTILLVSATTTWM